MSVRGKSLLKDYLGECTFFNTLFFKMPELSEITFKLWIFFFGRLEKSKNLAEKR